MACVVAGGGGHAWLAGGVHGCWGVCVVAGGGGGVYALLQGAC